MSCLPVKPYNIDTGTIFALAHLYFFNSYKWYRIYCLLIDSHTVVTRLLPGIERTFYKIEGELKSLSFLIFLMLNSDHYWISRVLDLLQSKTLLTNFYNSIFFHVNTFFTFLSLFKEIFVVEAEFYLSIDFN